MEEVKIRATQLIVTIVTYVIGIWRRFIFLMMERKSFFVRSRDAPVILSSVVNCNNSSLSELYHRLSLEKIIIM